MEIDKEIDGWVKQTIMERESVYKVGDVVMVKDIEFRVKITKIPSNPKVLASGSVVFSSKKIAFPLENILCSVEEVNYELNDIVLVEGVDSDVVIKKLPDSDIDYYEGDKFIDLKPIKIAFYRESILGHSFEAKFMKDSSELIASTPERYSSRNVNGMDVIDLVKHWGLNFNEGNILKYLIRDKGQDVEDLQKIINYAKRELEYRNK